MALINFDASAVEPSSFEAIPAGTYEAVIPNSEARPMKSGNGMGFNFEFEIVAGDYKGRKVFEWITFEHRTCPDAQRIGREQLSAMCRAVGVTQLNDTAQLHNLPILITLGIDRKDPTKNVIRGYKAKNAGGATSAGGNAPAPRESAPAPRENGAGAAPWAR